MVLITIFTAGKDESSIPFSRADPSIHRPRKVRKIERSPLSPDGSKPRDALKRADWLEEARA
jgi:hypothetical protein